MRKLIFPALFLMVSATAFAQDGYNPLSVRPIHSSDIMYKRTVTRALDLREPQNRPLFARNNEITKLLIEGVRNGKIKAYTNDSLTTQLTMAQFNKSMEIPSAGPVLVGNDTMQFFIDYGENWRDFVQTSADYFFAQDLYQMEIKEQVLFDKEHSRMTYDIQTVTIYVPADHSQNVRGVQTVVASFSYKELTEKLFKDNPNAMWYNAQNQQAHLNYTDAFELRLFSSYVIKMNNPMDRYISDYYTDQHTGIMASQWASYELMEYEHNLWEY